MFFYRLVVCRFLKFLGLDELYKERERRAIMLGKKKKPFHKPKLLMDENMKTYVFMILGVINLLFMLTLPLTMLSEPCEAFKKTNMSNFYAFTATVKSYATMIDRIMIMLSVALVYVAVKTVLDAIAVTKIDMSPWLEQGKYVLPGTIEFCDHEIRTPAQERARARAKKARYYDQMYQQTNDETYDQKFDKIFDEIYGQNDDQLYDELYNEAYDSDDTSDQTYNQTSDETSDHTFDYSYDQTTDQSSDLSSDQAKYDQTFDETYDLT